jgi:hypothetical protein
MQIRTVRTELFHVGRQDRKTKGQKDRYDEANSRFSQFFQLH